MKQERIDKLLVDRGLANSRTRAQALVMAGVVLVDEQLVTKSSEAFALDANIRVKGDGDPASRYVGRGGLKLEAALREFKIIADGLTCIDVGSSTGGFTDCLLQHGARSVVAVDVGHNQFDWRLRNEPRVELREGVNARYLKPEDFEQKFDLATIDVAFISATRILPAVVPLLTDHGRIITLIKPQFEVGKGEVGKGGIVKDPAQHQRVVAEVNSVAEELGLRVRAVTESPIHGADGNLEFLALYELVKASTTKSQRHEDK
ncbi:MAG: rRNA (cytidine1920-2-O)/16S rRNA (cytidine1409-2-O)-methyltransferase [Blastocatellia bacterium]|jgi:23S rRNA (cytidine1920-2'-O)/16S rRNA (cytidine1409-2'-O)-methyltransferase|nr:rRNA (cytidine1920-2-O)/16S rRNA (cytidine1409-2-O)-methyltransferase [Blastocatellia bacterium]MDX6574512.1 rRNA (cytidine1920-2-O)/16S rRNA (cytidine1409-2-O)-methyltransferase [Blastocatellia bacterium]